VVVLVYIPTSSVRGFLFPGEGLFKKISVPYAMPSRGAGQMLGKRLEPGSQSEEHATEKLCDPQPVLSLLLALVSLFMKARSWSGISTLPPSS
jgi:hypothetical protein